MFQANCLHGLIKRGTCSKCGKAYEFDYGQKGDHAFGDYKYDLTCSEHQASMEKAKDLIAAEAAALWCEEILNLFRDAIIDACSYK